MGSTTKIQLTNDRVFQLSGDTLTMSGTTNFTDGNKLLIGGIPISSVVSGQVIAPEQTITTTTSLTLDLTTYSYYPKILLNGNISNLIISGGSIGDRCSVILVQGTGGTLTLGSQWQTNTSYLIGEIVQFGSTLYKATQNHTSSLTSFNNDLNTKWVRYIYFPDGVIPILGIESGLRDLLYILKEDTDIYRVGIEYDQGS